MCRLGAEMGPGRTGVSSEPGEGVGMGGPGPSECGPTSASVTGGGGPASTTSSAIGAHVTATTGRPPRRHTTSSCPRAADTGRRSPSCAGPRGPGRRVARSGSGRDSALGEPSPDGTSLPGPSRLSLCPTGKVTLKVYMLLFIKSYRVRHIRCISNKVFQ